MRVERKQWGDVTLLTFIGEFDAYNLTTFSSKIDNLVEDGYHSLVFNLHLLKFINSSALGYLVKTKKLVEEKGGDIVIVKPSKFVKKALTVVGLHELFNIYETNEEAVLSFHKGDDVETLKLDQVEAEPDEKLLGANAIMFRLLDEAGVELLGPTPFVGKISSLYKNGLKFRWAIPAAGGRSKLSEENFDDFMHPGRTLSVKFRQPFVAKTKYFEATGSVMKAAKETVEEETTEALVNFEYTEIDAADKEALDRYVADLEDLRKEVG
jgi:anti-sigma B factor antagonist